MTWNTLTTWGPMYGQLSQDWAVAHDLMHFQIMTPNRSAAVRIPAFCTKSHWRKFYKKDASNRAQIRRLVRSYKKIFEMVATYDGSAPVQPDWAIFEGTSYKKTPPSCPNRRTFGQPLSSLSPSPSPSCGRRGNDVLHRPILPRFILPSWDQHCKTAKLICCKFFVKYFYWS